ncbi:MAG: 16S rRNA (cytosine(1402)-N(4))-methyltransferase RsmH [Alphaproteobacteria bacterium]|nr:16S rRNA (cytosine(1402)-N(4))-methyltransferase RsmH [Alphaproteobacteria bacterium]
MTHTTDHNAAPHVPVMLQEVLTALSPCDGGIYVDGTFGAGGYTRAILDSAACTVCAIDRDPDAIRRAQDMATGLNGRLLPLHGCFGDMQTLVNGAGHAQVDGIVLDIGVSSMQLDEAGRGFSFRHDGPLDMRMSQNGQSAGDFVNTADEKTLADVIYTYGEEHAARRIARRIIEARQEKMLKTTQDLAAVVHDVLPMHGGIKTDTATKTFQAIRIYINDELGELDRALDAALHLLRPEGRLVVVSFHSLEDRRVKNFLKTHSGRTPQVSRHMPMQSDIAPAPLRMEKNSGIAASETEIAANPRARSARLRYAIRTDAPPGAAHA